MSRKIVVYALVALFITSAGSLLQAAEGWITDYEAAKKQASKEGKDILMDFTGSDWCGWCIRLKKEVFSQASFKKQAPKHFVLLELDFPRAKKLEAKLKAQNEKLRDEFGINGYPTIMLTDAGGKPYARTGYQAGGPEKYIAHLAEKRAAKTVRDESFAAAEKAKDDTEKAKLLDKALSMIEKTGGIPVLSVYGDVVARIIKLDSDNKAGLKSKYGARFTLEDLNKKLQTEKYAEAIKGADAYLAEKGGEKETRQKVAFLKARAMFMQSKGQDFKGTIAALEAARALAPETSIGKQIPNILKGLKAQAEKQTGENAPKPKKTEKSE
jgi:thioredoxin-related protein